jgi:hypothetical protein
MRNNDIPILRIVSSVRRLLRKAFRNMKGTNLIRESLTLRWRVRNLNGDGVSVTLTEFTGAGAVGHNPYENYPFTHHALCDLNPPEREPGYPRSYDSIAPSMRVFGFPPTIEFMGKHVTQPKTPPIQKSSADSSIALHQYS